MSTNSYWVLVDGWDNPVLQYGNDSHDVAEKFLADNDNRLTKPSTQICVWRYGSRGRMYRYNAVRLGDDCDITLRAIKEVSN